MHFKILGPVRVTNRSSDADLGSRKQRALLCVLLLDANRVVSTDRIIDALWGSTEAPPNASTLHAYVSRLRRALRPDRRPGGGDCVVARRAGGYVLQVDASDVDFLEFERLVDEATAARRGGDVVRTVHLLDNALALWRGHVLGDLHDEEFARADVVRLEARRLDAAESRLEALLAAGQPDAVVADARSLLAEHPLRERLRGLLMVSLYRVGRQAEALATYREGRHLLVEELGIEPGPALRRLEVQILHQDPVLQLPADVPATITSHLPIPLIVPEPLGTSGSFVGRRVPMAFLDDAWRQVPDGPIRLALVSGEPGVGKSRLALEVVRHAHAAGAMVLYGACSEETAIPYQPFTEALRAFARSAPTEVLRQAVLAAGPAIGHLMPELPRRVPELHRTETASPETERHLMFEAAVDLFRAISERAPVVFVLDDLHWADEATWLLLAHLVRSARPSPMLVLATLRNAEIEAAEAGSILSELRRRHLAVHVPLEGLDVGDVDVLVGERLGVRSPTFVTAIHEHTHGNPFYIEQLVRHLAEAGAIETGSALGMDLLKSGVPAEVSEVITRRVAKLPSGAADLLTIGAVVGREFSLHVLSAVTGLKPDEVVEAMDDAARSGLIAEVAVGVYSFVHPLTRQALDGELSATRRALLHHRIGELLAAADCDRDGGNVSAIAHHLLLGGLDPQRSADYAWRASMLALDRLAHEEATTLAERGLRALDADPAPSSVASRRCDLLVVLAECCRRAGDSVGAHRHLLEAGKEARRLDDPRRLAEVGLSNPRGMVSASPEADPARAEVLDAALAALPTGDDPLRARVLGQLAVERFFRADRAHVRTLSAKALAMARRLADPAVVEHVLLCRHVALQDPSHVDERLAVLDQLEATASNLGHHETLLLGRLYRVVAFMEQGDVAAADALMEHCERDLEDIRLPLLRFAPNYYRAMRTIMSGPLDEAERSATETLTTLQRAGYPDALAIFGAQLYQLRWLQGRLGELEGLARQAAAGQVELPIWRAILTHVLSCAGRPDEAAVPYELLARDDFAAIPFDNMWMTSMAACAEVAVARRDRARAAVLYEALAPYASRPVILATAVACLGAVDRTLGLLAAACGRSEAAGLHFDEAARLHRTWHADALVEMVERDRRRSLSGGRFSGGW